MASTRTPGITIDADGRRFIDKHYRGVRIGMRVGPVTQDQAEQRLQTEIPASISKSLNMLTRAPSFATVPRVTWHSRTTNAASRLSEYTYDS